MYIITIKIIRKNRSNNVSRNRTLPHNIPWERHSSADKSTTKHSKRSSANQRTEEHSTQLRHEGMTVALFFDPKNPNIRYLKCMDNQKPKTHRNRES